MKEMVWDSVLKQMVKEYGQNPNLEQVNILNTDFSYQRKPEKLPSAVIEQVKKETKERLTKLGLSYS